MQPLSSHFRFRPHTLMFTILLLLSILMLAITSCPQPCQSKPIITPHRPSKHGLPTHHTKGDDDLVNHTYHIPINREKKFNGVEPLHHNDIHEHVDQLEIETALQEEFESPYEETMTSEAPVTVTVTLSNGNRWEGPMKREMPHGFGVMQYANGDRYVGPFTFGQRHGGEQVSMEYNATRYNSKEVIWMLPKVVDRLSTRLSQAARFFSAADGSECVGNWLNDTMHGVYTCTYPDHSEWNGEMRHGQRHGWFVTWTSEGELENMGWNEPEYGTTYTPLVPIETILYSQWFEHYWHSHSMERTINEQFLLFARSNINPKLFRLYRGSMSWVNFNDLDGRSFSGRISSSALLSPTSPPLNLFIPHEHGAWNEIDGFRGENGFYYYGLHCYGYRRSSLEGGRYGNGNWKVGFFPFNQYLENKYVAVVVSALTVILCLLSIPVKRTIDLVGGYFQSPEMAGM